MARTLEDVLRDRPVDRAEVDRLKAEMLAAVRAEEGNRASGSSAGPLHDEGLATTLGMGSTEQTL